MHLIRAAEISDLHDLMKLARMVHFINLPNDLDELQYKLQRSIDSFGGKIREPRDREYMFVMVDAATNELCGTSCIIARHGTPDAPHIYFKMEKIKKYSDTIKTGTIQELLKLEFMDNGPTEVGGLIVLPWQRNSGLKLGKQLSWIRFHFIARCRSCFQDRLLAEMMAPLARDGSSQLWKMLGRKFINLPYEKADALSRTNKEFITSLFPEYPIYVCMLEPKVREIIGTVGKETVPARKMLEDIGFRYHGMIDPFDGGPHLWAETDAVIPVTKTYRYRCRDTCRNGGADGLISREGDNSFRAVLARCRTDGRNLAVDPQAKRLLGIRDGDEAWMTPWG